MAYHVTDVKPIALLKERYGDEIVLEGHQNEETVFQIVAEFALGDRQYAVLQSESLKLEDNVNIYRITMNQDGEPELESIDDDDEWDDVYDVYDEMTYRFDDEA
jgi:uncharacterized protein YrzB (UPF0473 family)